MSINSYKKIIDKDSVHMSTWLAIERGKALVKQATNFANDPQQKERKKASQCKICFYVSSRIGGQAITDRPCGICGKIMTFSSTCTDIICPECAENNHLCVHCGADVELRPRRKYLPS